MIEKSFFIRVIGCQMNVYDGDKLRGELLSRGWQEAESEDCADFVVFLTCSVRERAEQKAASEIGKFGKKWKKSHRPRLALLGCMAARLGDNLARKFPWIAVAAGPAHMGLVPDAMDRALETGARFVAGSETRAAGPISCAPRSRGNPHKAYVTVANGCDQFCAYCIVPYVRGRFASRAPDDVLDEARELVRNGAVEITLLGQNVDAYGKDFGGGARGRFASLLNGVSSIDGLRRVRFATSHPSDFTDDILDVMGSRPNICPSINLPVQAGSDRVLREMNRRYTKDEYVSLVRRIRAALPEPAITTDLIVGFPGETEDDFEESVALFGELRFDLAHTAAYSPRDGTPAASRPDQVPAAERARRLVRLNGVQTEISRKINASMVGKTYEVLLDEPAPKGEGMLQGRTATDKVVLVRAPLEMAGTFREARVIGSSPWCLEGELV
ncbi:MAG: tRNA (N6-isopentenyl adenosine(37)-C2)-methylthiotransferase MiaB [Synergistaceae bacterium]|nr:tRNA (N6-isopentenyl adenosine(37)-C2)-methylthiotransferase MiaB [Synergistaceae bacterium]